MQSPSLTSSSTTCSRSTNTQQITIGTQTSEADTEEIPEIILAQAVRIYRHI